MMIIMTIMTTVMAVIILHGKIRTSIFPLAEEFPLQQILDIDPPLRIRKKLFCVFCRVALLF